MVQSFIAQDCEQAVFRREVNERGISIFEHVQVEHMKELNRSAQGVRQGAFALDVNIDVSRGFSLDQANETN